MTRAQFQKKVEVAKKTGNAKLPNGCTLYFHGYWCGISQGFTIEAHDGNVIVFTYDPMREADLFE